MAHDLIHRPDWTPAVSAADTIIGRYSDPSGFYDTPAVRSIPDDLPASLASRWNARESGGLGFRLGIAQNAAATVLGRLTEESQADLVAAVDSLPESARTAIYDELAQGVSGYVRDASQAEVNAFSASDIGRELVKEWGGRAAKRIATFNKRADRMLDSMSDQDFGYFMARFTSLDGEQAAAVIRELAR
ncbi:hypothetical protein [Sinorhizobium fredii]|uniref:hypothetical protein n=1 Tax=Rhizobium fredii TaxID=380 RepID=UPI00351516B2